MHDWNWQHACYYQQLMLRGNNEAWATEAVPGNPSGFLGVIVVLVRGYKQLYCSYCTDSPGSIDPMLVGREIFNFRWHCLAFVSRIVGGLSNYAWLFKSRMFWMLAPISVISVRGYKVKGSIVSVLRRTYGEIFYFTDFAYWHLLFRQIGSMSLACFSFEACHNC